MSEAEEVIHKSTDTHMVDISIIAVDLAGASPVPCTLTGTLITIVLSSAVVVDNRRVARGDGGTVRCEMLCILPLPHTMIG